MRVIWFWVVRFGYEAEWMLRQLLRIRNSSKRFGIEQYKTKKEIWNLELQAQCRKERSRSGAVCVTWSSLFPGDSNAHLGFNQSKRQRNISEGSISRMNPDIVYAFSSHWWSDVYQNGNCHLRLSALRWKSEGSKGKWYHVSFIPTSIPFPSLSSLLQWLTRIMISPILLFWLLSIPPSLSIVFLAIWPILRRFLADLP